MKKLAFALIPAVLSSAAFANFTDVAQVVSATPIMDRVSTPRQECFTETVTAPANAYVAQGRAIEPVNYSNQSASASPGGSGAGAIVGAIIGGVVGHQFGGSSRGRDHGTVAGAVVGGLLGSAIGSSSNATAATSPSYAQGVQPSVYAPASAQPQTRTVERCRTVNDAREQVSGYNVTYRYGNQTYTTRMAQDPGSTIRVRVNVTPEAVR